MEQPRGQPILAVLVLLVLAAGRTEALALDTRIMHKNYSFVAQIAATAAFDLPRYTLFAPDNAAFDRLGCLSLWNQSSLAIRILEYHLLDEPYSAQDFLDIIVSNSSWNPASLYKTKALQFSLRKNTITVNGGAANVTDPDLVKGYSKAVHGINSVLMPPGLHAPSDCANFVFQLSSARASDKLGRRSLAGLALAFILSAAALAS